MLPRPMKRPLYIIDAFSDHAFGGNPAAVVLLAADDRPDDARLAAIAEEMNLSETAFVSPPAESGEPYGLRWFTPVREVDLCGHATLAAAHALYDAGKVSLHEPIRFATRSGELRAAPDSDWRGFWLDFPPTPPVEAEPPAALLDAVGLHPSDLLFAGRGLPPDGADDASANDYFDWFLVVASPDAVLAVRPDFDDLAAATTGAARGAIVAAVGTDDSAHAVSRCFYPSYGVDEDPVTGSAHCTIGPYFARTLNRDELLCRQLSRRGGIVRVRTDSGDRHARVHLGGRAVTTVRGELVA